MNIKRSIDHLVILNFLNVRSAKKAIRLIASFIFAALALKLGLFFLAPVTQRSMLVIFKLWQLKAFRPALQGELIQFRQIFFGAERSGGAALAKINLAERSVGAVTLKIFGAERSG
jgi:hypothetical protein